MDGNLLEQSKFSTLQGGLSLNNSDAVGTTTELNTSTPQGFTCTYNVVRDLNTSDGYVDGVTFGVELGLLCISPDVYSYANYAPYELGQNNSGILGIYSGVPPLAYFASRVLKADSFLTESVNASRQTDLHIVPLPSSTTVRTYLSASGKITVASIDTFENNDGNTLFTWTGTVLLRHISASSFSASNVVYAYYQVNDTAIEELRYGLDAGIWDLDPLSIHLDEYYGTMRVAGEDPGC